MPKEFKSTKFVFSNRRGQATLLSVLAMGGFLAVVLTFVSQYTQDLARLNKRSKDNVLIRGIVEEIAVELRKSNMESNQGFASKVR